MPTPQIQLPRIGTLRRDELLAAEVTDLSQARGDVVLVSVRRAYQVAPSALLLDVARLSPTAQSAVAQSRAPVLHASQTPTGLQPT